MPRPIMTSPLRNRRMSFLSANGCSDRRWYKVMVGIRACADHEAYRFPLASTTSLKARLEGVCFSAAQEVNSGIEETATFVSADRRAPTGGQSRAIFTKLGAQRGHRPRL